MIFYSVYVDNVCYILYNINMKIVDGPSRDALADGFVRRLPVSVKLNDGKLVYLLINEIKHEDGSGWHFLFTTAKGATGYYNAEERKGHIDPLTK